MNTLPKRSPAPRVCGKCRARQQADSMSNACGRISPYFSGRFAEKSWCTWTMRRPRRNRGGDRRAAAVLRVGERQHPSRRALSFRAGHRGLRRRRAPPYSIFWARRCQRDHFRARRNRGRSTWSLRPTAARTYRRRRRNPDHRHGAPLQHRALADAVRGEGRQAARRSDQRRRRADLRAFEQLLSPRTKLVAVTHVPMRWGRSTRSSRIVELAHARGVPVLVDGAQSAPHLPDRRAGAGLRFLRLLRPQDVRPDGHRRPLRQGSSARSHASLPGRRRHDRLGHLREDDLQRAAIQVRSGHAEHRRRHRTSARRSITLRPSASRTSPPTSTNCCLRHGSVSADSRRCASSARPARRPACFPS